MTIDATASPVEAWAMTGAAAPASRTFAAGAALATTGAVPSREGAETATDGRSGCDDWAGAARTGSDVSAA